MNRNQLRNIHRWIFTATGIFILIWLLSGILMVLPQNWFGDTARHKNPPMDYSKAVLSPADAIARLDASSTRPVEINNIKLRQVNEHLLYSILLADGSEQLIDAMQGERFHFSPELAEAIIRSSFNIRAPLVEIERLTEHNSVYPWGSLPVFRMTFTDSTSVSYFMAEKNLKVFLSSPVTRLRSAITSLHEFIPVNLLTRDARVRHWLLIIISTIALAGAVIGLLMTLPKRRNHSSAGRERTDLSSG